jgi:hypothetical protein
MDILSQYGGRASAQLDPHFLTRTATSNDQGWQYLDMAAEYSGFLYVLSYNENTFLYRMDIYHPTQEDTAPISTTQHSNAAKLTVDFWRNVYTLNYEVLQLPGNGITEPTVSLWVPTGSCTGANCTASCTRQVAPTPRYIHSNQRQ